MAELREHETGRGLRRWMIEILVGSRFEMAWMLGAGLRSLAPLLAHHEGDSVSARRAGASADSGLRQSISSKPTHCRQGYQPRRRKPVRLAAPLGARITPLPYE